MNNRRVLLGVLLCASLAGCSGSHMAQLHRFVATADNGYRPPVKPVPKVTAPKIVLFDMHHFADPFEPFAMRLPARGPNPDLNKPKGPLQQYSLAEIRMVGTLSAGKQLWAIVTTPGGATYRAHVGTYMGEHFGRVVRITADKIYLKELRPGPTGWVEQSAILAIQ